MKKVLMILLVLPLVVFARKLKPEVQYAIEHGAMAKFSLQVLNEQGEAVTNANVHVIFSLPLHSVYGQTDTNGICVIEGKTNGNSMKIFVEKEGYYGSKKKISYISMGKEHEVKDGKWQPYGAKEVIQLRKIRDPVSLCKLGFGAGREIPCTNLWIGVDMAQGDFVKPHGKGERADFEVMVEWDGRPPVDCGYCAAFIRFTDRLTGGYYVPKVSESEYPYVYHADKNNAYTVRQIEVVRRNKDRQGKLLSLGDDTVFVTRTRCVEDEDGKLKSACYGFVRVFSVDAGWNGKSTIRLACVFNQTPNDTNLEDDELYQRNKRLRGNR